MTPPLPAFAVTAQFTPGTPTDISQYAMNFHVSRPSTRVQGPLWQYQAGTCQVLLDNSDGRFDPDNLAGPYTSSTGLQQVVWTQAPNKTGTWVAPRNLSGTTIKVEAWGPGSVLAGGQGGGGGEYAAELTYTVIPGNSYAVVTPAQNSGSNTTFDGSGVVANGAAAGSPTGATGSTNSIHFNGANGGAAGTGNPARGGGGGSSGGSTAAGNNGGSGNSGGAAGAAPAGGYGGGTGAPDGRYAGGTAAGPGGGGGGQGSQTSGNRTSTSKNGRGKGGQIRLTYFVTITSAATVTQVLPRIPVQVTATWPANFLTLAASGSVHNSDVEGTDGTWQVRSNCTLTNSAAQQHSGANSMSMTSGIAGNMTARHCVAANYATQMLPVVPGQLVACSAWFRAQASPRSCSVGADFYDVTGAGIGAGSVQGPNVTDTTTGWVQATDGGQVAAPAGAAWAALVPVVNGTAAGGEVHYLDDFGFGGFYPLFTGTADSWQETPVSYSAGYSEVTLSATDGFKLLSGNIIPATAGVGGGEDSGARADRILDWAGWDPAARQLDAGDTVLQATTLGSDALSLLQLTADAEIGEVYVNGSGTLVFRHRQGLLTDTRSVYPQAVFGDQPGVQDAQVTWHGDGVHGGIGVSGDGGLFNAATLAAKQAWVWSSAAYASGVQMVINYYDNTLTLISSSTGTITATGPVPVLLPVTGTSPAGTTFINVQIQVQGTPASSVTFSAAAGVPLAGDIPFTHSAAPWTAMFGTTTATTTGNWVPLAGVPGELAYAAVGRANDDTTLANDIQITAAGSSNLQEATDPISVYVYQSERSWARTDLPLPDDATAFQYANWVLYVSKNSEDRFDTLTVDPLADTANLWPQVLGREIGDRIQIWRTPAGVASRVTKDVFVRGIDHQFDATSNAWLTGWTLQSADRYGGFMTLDSAVNGELDQKALAY